MRIDTDQLEQHLARGLGSFYTIHGDEPLLALEAADRLRSQARAAGFDERVLLVVEPGFDWGRLNAAGASLSLFAQRRLIELRIPNGKPGVAGAQALIDYAAHPPQDTITVVQLPALDWRTLQSEWVQALDAAGSLVEARRVDRARLPRWLGTRLARQQQSTDPDTLQFIADRVEGNLLAAWQELQKLALLFPPGKLGADDVRNAVLDAARYEVAGLSEALLAGDATQYVRVLNGLQAEAAGLPLVVWTLANDLRSAHAVLRAMERRVPSAQALREARVFGPRRSAFERALKRWTKSQLAAALERCAAIDRLSKGLGRADPWNALRDLGLTLTASCAPPVPRRASV